MKKHRLLFLWLSLLLCAVGARADEITVNEGTVTDSNIPLYGLYVDNFFVSQFIIPSGDLPSGATLSSMTFATKDASYDWGSFTCEVYLGEVDEASFPSTGATIYDWSTLTKVYEGSPTISDNKMVIGFSSDYSYGGGNLLVGFKITSKSNGYKSTYWYGVESTGGAIYGYNSGSVEAINNYSVKNFLPQVTFEYTGGTTIIPKPTNLAVTLTPGDGSRATLSWTENGTATQWEICLVEDMDNLITTTTNPFELFPITPEMTYTAKVRAVVGEERSNWSNTVTFTPTNAYNITVNDGANVNNYVPIYGYYVDNISKSQFIIPAEELTNMLYGSIEKMTFYANEASVNWGVAEFEVYITEVSNTTFDSNILVDWSSMEKVKNAGTLTISENKMVVTLDNPYQYLGGNLMIGFLQTKSGTYKTSTWFGASQTGITALGGYGTSINGQQFLPKTTFNYAPGEAPSCIKPTNLAVNYEGGNTAVVSWTSDASAWNLDVNGDVISVTENPYTLENLELATIYEVKVQTDCGGSTSDWTAPATFITDICLPEDQCEISYELTDSYGDGWSGNAISIVDKETGTEVANLTIASGNSAEGAVALCNGRVYEFRWVYGGGYSYPDECSFVFTDVKEEEILNVAAGSAPTTSTTLLEYTMDCSVDPCPKPKDLSVEPMQDYAIVHWMGTSAAYNLQWRSAAKDDWAFFDDFENGLDQWTTIINAEGSGWTTTQPSSWTGSFSAHSGDYVAMARSYEGGVDITADNWLISPEVELGGTLKFWVMGDPNYPEAYSVLVSTRGTNPDDFDNLISYTTNPDSWEQVSIDLSAYRGESGYVAIHHEATGGDILWIDDFGISKGEIPAGEWSMLPLMPATGKPSGEEMVMISNLDPATEYEYQIRGVCDGTPGEWTAIKSFTTLSENTKTFFADNGDWDESSNWEPAGVPTANDDVFIRGHVIIPDGVLAEAKTAVIGNNLFSGELGSITIKDGGQLRQGSSDLVVTLEKEATGVEAGVRRGYDLISSPVNENVAATDVENLLENGYQYYRFVNNMSLEWFNYDLTSFDMTPGNGYLYGNANQTPISITGPTWASVDNGLSMTLTYNNGNSDYDGWRLVGNPFTCNAYLLFADGSTIESATFYKMNAAHDGYDIYENSVALAPGEAAFIKFDKSGTIYYFTEDYETGEPVDLANYSPSGSTIIPLLPQGGVDGNQDANLPLEDASYDNSTILADLNTEAAPVVLNGRTLYRDTKWNTICLPFNVTLEGSILEGAIVKPLADATVTDKHVSLTFGDAVNAIEAGVPYIIKWEEAGEDIVNPSFGWVTIQGDEPVSLDFASGQVKFIGYYDAFDITADDSDIWYMKSDNTLTHTAKPRTLKAFRTYFQLSEELSSGVNSFSIDFGDGETSTGITEIADSSAPEGYFNLQGVKFDNAPKQKGVYIVNGKKVVVK